MHKRSLEGGREGSNKRGSPTNPDNDGISQKIYEEMQKEAELRDKQLREAAIREREAAITVKQMTGNAKMISLANSRLVNMQQSMEIKIQSQREEIRSLENKYYQNDLRLTREVAIAQNEVANQKRLTEQAVMELKTLKERLAPNHLRMYDDTGEGGSTGMEVDGPRTAVPTIKW